MRYLEPILKIALAVLFFVCLLDMPYGYYEFVRFLALVIFGVFAYKANVQNKNTAVIIYASLVLLFQPFFKVALGREIWNIVDVIVGIGLIVSIFIDFSADQNKCK